MASASTFNSERIFSHCAHCYYSLLMAHAETQAAGEPGLGGKLLYAGDLDENGRALVVAANIAGAAALCASADPVAQKNAMRDGIVDFVVTNFDEALRILKNEIRKRQGVAVSVAAPSEDIESQMAARGVLPDILRPPDQVSAQNKSLDGAVVTWMVLAAPARWMPRLDALAVQCAEGRHGATHRWLRMAPRYLGRLAQSTHLVHADREFAISFIERLQSLGDCDVPVIVQVNDADGLKEYQFGPSRPPDA
jgi:hypothetical protein